MPSLACCSLAAALGNKCNSSASCCSLLHSEDSSLIDYLQTLELGKYFVEILKTCPRLFQGSPLKMLMLLDLHQFLKTLRELQHKQGNYRLFGHAFKCNKKTHYNLYEEHKYISISQLITVMHGCKLPSPSVTMKTFAVYIGINTVS